MGIGNALSLVQTICIELWARGGELDTAVRRRDPTELILSRILQKCDFFVVRPPRCGEDLLQEKQHKDSGTLLTREALGQ